MPGCRHVSVQAEQLLASGKAKYEGGDRMGALRLWEQALEQSPTQEQRLAALFNSACVHASFGDVELAQIPLKDAIYGGLDYAAAVAQQDERFVKLKASAQVMIQMRKFNEQVLRSKASGPAAPPSFGSGSRSSSSGGGGGGSSSKASGKGLLGKDMSDVLSTDAESIDASIGGIIKRVAVLLLVLSGLGVVLFYLGLKYAFPESPY
ncbi:hypothetical protein CHLNCDRAFT_142863 [Chlorella variabilis]|uniref:Uncharacterized protein n=1 Tax=Chlorella variabilis TaxID=554065 RepID=E1Z8X6_CHLVA|nr:hypothetical protein CHLNCDRAFT_142863 [Chlorella variabilis]EFN57418.1 hypothetical protein CHLNCDRAFT_142863 [Chlorella variabilis]|eukprot:XP_005849520.1 hypothetical protein CHLNCDRAFT_142863 [Chlorella variabilis]